MNYEGYSHDDFEQKRKEIVDYFLRELRYLYVQYDELQPGETLVVQLEVEPQESTNESFGFSDN